MSRALPQYAFFLLATAFLLIGCGSVGKYRQAESLYYAGQYAQAAQSIDNREISSNAVLAQLYAGSSWLMAGNPANALTSFRRAEQGMEIQDQTLNWGNAYLARTYDGIQMQTYQGLAMLAQGQSDNARVAFNRLEERQGKASRRNQAAIRKRQQETANVRNSQNNAQAASSVDSALNDSRNQAKIAEYNHLLDTWGAYADYENPASRFLSGLYRMFYRETGDASDAEKAAFQMRLAYGMTNSPVAQQAYVLAEALANGHDEQGKAFTQANIDNYVAVIFENGLGPEKKEWRFDLFIPYWRPLYAGIALPYLVKRPVAHPHLTLGDGSAQIGVTQPLCDVDRIVATEFRQEMPSIVAAAVTSAVIKVVLQAVISNGVAKHNNNLAGFLTGTVGSVLAAATTHADIRHWNLLPKEYQVALLPKPTSGTLTLGTPAGTALFNVTLPQQGPAIVFVKIPAVNLPGTCLLMGPGIHP
ncbi:MAG: hypothetical protein IJJ33_01800 [Victivallales bacterium]|nr:hypothetical protein [Victivallales bacterium]